MSNLWCSQWHVHREADCFSNGRHIVIVTLSVTIAHFICFSAAGVSHSTTQLPTAGRATNTDITISN